MHICYLNIHQSASIVWAWEPLLCYQNADPIPESPQAPTCSLPTPWAPLPTVHTLELTTLGLGLFAFSKAGLLSKSVNEGSALMEECRCMFGSVQTEHNRRHPELPDMATCLD